MAMGNDVVHVAVKNDVRESRSTLLWALKNLGAKKVCILHVYQPKTASPAGNFHYFKPKLTKHRNLYILPWRNVCHLLLFV